MSLGGRRPNQTCDMAVQTAVTNAIGRGTVVVIAAGNNNEDTSFASPGNCNGVITVAAVGRTGQRASYSNFDDNDGNPASRSRSPRPEGVSSTGKPLSCRR